MCEGYMTLATPSAEKLNVISLAKPRIVAYMSKRIAEVATKK